MSEAFLPDGEPLSLLFEKVCLPKFDLPSALAAVYQGDLGFERPRVLANFVSSVDGVVAFADRGESGHLISGGNAADRFVMGLLRACADTVLIGAGTFRKTPAALWTAEAIYPAAKDAFADARRRLGLPPTPRFVVVSGSGAIDVSQPALRDALVVTTNAGKTALAPRLASTTELLVVESDVIRLDEVLLRLSEQGTRVLLTEGGPSLFAELVSRRLVDELFLTTSPALFGRFPNDHRKGLGDGLNLEGTSLELLSARRHRSFLFLRYAIAR